MYAAGKWHFGRKPLPATVQSYSCVGHRARLLLLSQCIETE